MWMHDKTQTALLLNPFKNSARQLYCGTPMPPSMPAADLLVQSQRETVLIAAGYLFAHQHQQTLVPALPSCRPGFQCIVIGDDEKVQIGPLPGLNDLRHRPGAIGMDRMDVDRADGFVKLFDISFSFRKTRAQGSGIRGQELQGGGSGLIPDPYSPTPAL
jgi:hypothetical protein